MPEVFKELSRTCKFLENHYRCIQDVEFTAQDGELFILQTRDCKKTAKAALSFVRDAVQKNLMTRQEAVLSIDPDSIDRLFVDILDPSFSPNVIAKGFGASPGCVSGKVVFCVERAVELAGRGEGVILVRVDTNPDDFVGMHAARGILTSKGGVASHAAVVARAAGKPCVCGANIVLDSANERFTAEGVVVKQDEIITIDGSSGCVILGDVPRIKQQNFGEFARFMRLTEGDNLEHKRMEVYANADTANEIRTAVDFGAVGVGLCRTEHMFFGKDKIKAVREFILAQTPSHKTESLKKIQGLQQADFEQIFTTGVNVIVRLLDPPMHEFLPKINSDKESIDELASALSLNFEQLCVVIKELGETNPMLGFRGCRIGALDFEIYKTQVIAMVRAAIAVKKEKNLDTKLIIMIPFVMCEQEFILIKERVNQTIQHELKSRGTSLKSEVGVMIELPRAALIADKIAQHADFFSFGTNDLTQTTLGISRDDSGKISFGLYIARAN